MDIDFNCELTSSEADGLENDSFNSILEQYARNKDVLNKVNRINKVKFMDKSKRRMKEKRKERTSPIFFIDNYMFILRKKQKSISETNDNEIFIIFFDALDKKNLIKNDKVDYSISLRSIHRAIPLPIKSLNSSSCILCSSQFIPFTFYNHYCVKKYRQYYVYFRSKKYIFSLEGENLSFKKEVYNECT